VWSGEAQVHVSIVNWVKGDEPSVKRLVTQIGENVDDEWKVEELRTISPTLSSATDVSPAQALAASQIPKCVFQGQNPVSRGFFVTEEQASKIIAAEPTSREVIFPYMIGRDLVEDYAPSRWVIDFAQRDQFAARQYKLAFEHVKECVMPEVIAKAEAEKTATGKESTRWTRMANKWWQFRDYQPGTMSALARIPRYVSCARVTKRPIFEFISSDIHPDTMLIVFPFADDYSFGILQSDLHWRWFKGRCSTLGGTFRYTSDTVFDTFPWPQGPTWAQIKAVAEAAVELRALRRETMRKLNYSLRDLYRTLEQPGDNRLREAHTRLDAAVRAAYGLETDADPLAFLLELNLACAAKEKAGEKITPPGLPLPANDQQRFVTEDCIQLPKL
jgi:hypothetical protein